MARDCSVPPNQSYLLREPVAAGNGLMVDGARRNDMHPEQIMKPDLISEIVLMTFGTLILSSLGWFAMAAFARP
jgi:hypothetical protein